MAMFGTKKKKRKFKLREVLKVFIKYKVNEMHGYTLYKEVPKYP